jgi:hypothetical protein
VYVKERILTIRLMERLQDCLEYAKMLGVEIPGGTTPLDIVEKGEREQ